MAENNIKVSERLVAIGGSAGSLEVIFRMLSSLNADLQLSIVIILHRKYSSDSTLVDLLSTKTPLRLKEAEEKELIVPGTIYLAPADYHLLIENDKSFSLDYSEKLNFSRPSIDVTFESAAEVFGKNVAGILLSGANQDGVAGLQEIKKYNGLAVVQDPATAEVSYMPQHAIDNLAIDHILPPDELSFFINDFAKR